MAGDIEPEDRREWAEVVPLTRNDVGGDDGTRTRDPLLAKHAKPDLSESPRTILAAQSHYVIVSG
jgi:hypothetical protein